MPLLRGRERQRAMNCWAVLATGPSMSQEVADSVRGRCSVIAVSDAYRLAPWADVLVSQDAGWWRVHPDSKDFKGRKFAGVDVPDVEKFPSASGCNSGLLACQVAVSLGAKRILLLGVELRGAHFFGLHPKPLRNTQPHRFDAFQEQFKRYQPKGVDIVNVTDRSALKCYRRSTLEAELACAMSVA